ncbi:MAG TPA: hypothetical protein VGN32_08295 [Ktedonobacterales bacterium]|jgi:hypothetical protein|nr:hypothetical protein [Ktedonobacterales bacterium]
MTRKRDEDNREPLNDDELSELFALPEDVLPAFAAEADEPEAATGAEDAADAEPEAVLPTEEDLESQGFSPDEVRRLVLVSDQQASSSESQIAEATLRRMRFARWLIDHGVLDEWSA